MKITFTPRDYTGSSTMRELTLSKFGDVLTINGEAFDFSGVGEGDILPADAIATPLIAHDVTRVAGDLQITMILPVGADASDAARFPDPIINPADGTIEVPQ